MAVRARRRENPLKLRLGTGSIAGRGLHLSQRTTGAPLVIQVLDPGEVFRSGRQSIDRGL